MEIKSIKKLKEPAYPTLFYVVNNPALLSKNVPKSWLRNRYAATSLVVFMCCACNNNQSVKKKLDSVAVSGTSPVRSNAVLAPPPAIVHTRFARQRVTVPQDGSTTVSPMKVAPVFVHGNGSGGIGCIAVSPPVFISEEEAKTIILDEFKKAGLTFDTKDCPVFVFKAPAIADECPEEHKGDEKFSRIKLKMDGFNKDLNLAFEYVSTSDYELFQPNVGKNGVLCSSSFQSYDTKQAAEIIRYKLRSNSKAHVGVFYDPIVHCKDGDDWRSSMAVAEHEAKENLIAQVSDFIEWIKKEGILNE